MASAKSLIVLGAILSAGPAFAQSATLNQSGGTTAMERTAPAGERPRVVNDSENGSAEVQAAARTGAGETPVNGIGGTGGGRFSGRLINNSERERVGTTEGPAPQAIGDGPVGGIDVGLDLPQGRLAAGSTGDLGSQSIGGTDVGLDLPTGRLAARSPDAQSDLRARQSSPSGSAGPGRTAAPSATPQPTNGVGGQGGGRLSNRDHIDQDAELEVQSFTVPPIAASGQRNRRPAPAAVAPPPATSAPATPGGGPRTDGPVVPDASAEGPRGWTPVVPRPREDH